MLFTRRDCACSASQHLPYDASLYPFSPSLYYALRFCHNRQPIHFGHTCEHMVHSLYKLQIHRYSASCPFQSRQPLGLMLFNPSIAAVPPPTYCFGAFAVKSSLRWYFVYVNRMAPQSSFRLSALYPMLKLHCLWVELSHGRTCAAQAHNCSVCRNW